MAKKKKKHRSAYDRAADRIERDGRKHLFLIYGAAGIALNRHYGKGRQAILNFFDMTGEVWHTCAQSNLNSMIQMCYEETGIEVQCGNGKSWEELPYLNAEIDTKRYTLAQLTYIRQRQVEWVPAQVMACVMLTLHRKYGFGFDRLSRFYQQVQDIQAEYGGSPEKVREACYKATGVDVTDEFTRKRKETA